MEDSKKPAVAASTRRRSSLLQRARMSFARSGGRRGADVKTLRGTSGAEFENQGRIHRGAEGLSCCCFGGGGDDGHKERLILIKGPFCFVYKNEEAPSPKYAIGLQHLKAEMKHATEYGRHVVFLTSNLGDIEYELSFATEDVARQFVTAANQEATTAAAEEVRKRLGHEHLMVKRSSVRYAETIAKQKVKDQPDAPITSSEIIRNMPMTAM